MMLCRNYRKDAEMTRIDPVHCTAMTRLGIKEGKTVAIVSVKVVFTATRSTLQGAFSCGVLV